MIFSSQKAFCGSENPIPKYVVFYSGSRKEPERQTLRLTESFEKASGEEARAGQAAVECDAEVYNINWGNNKNLMKQCGKLYEYPYRVEQVRIYLPQGILLKTAIDLAVEDCIQSGKFTPRKSNNNR